MRPLRCPAVLALLLALCTGASARAAPALTRTQRTLVSEPGIQLSLHEVRAAGPGARGVPLLLLHGARVPGAASFDLPVEGGSLAAELARAGHAVYLLDVRGYGGSTRPALQSRAPQVHSFEAVRDVYAAVQWVKRRARVAQVGLLGWATGGHWAGMYASLYPEDVSHLVMLNALYGAKRGHAMLGPGGSFADKRDPERFDAEGFGAYQLADAKGLLAPWDRSIPLPDKARWRDPAVAEAYVREALASDPTSAQRSPPSLRAPTGALEDSFYLASGRQLWDAAPIRARVLLLRSELDFWSRPEDLTLLRAHLVNAREVRAVTLPQATHMVHLDRPEHGRARLLTELGDFLAAR